jgi:hypothetical protein
VDLLFSCMDSVQLFNINIILKSKIIVHINKYKILYNLHVAHCYVHEYQPCTIFRSYNLYI